MEPDTFLENLKDELITYFNNNPEFLKAKNKSELNSFVNGTISKYDKNIISNFLKKDFITDEDKFDFFWNIFIETINFRRDIRTMDILKSCIMKTIIYKVFVKAVFNMDTLDFNELYDPNLSKEQNIIKFIRTMETHKPLDSSKVAELVNEYATDLVAKYDKDADIKLFNYKKSNDLKFLTNIQNYIGKSINFLIQGINTTSSDVISFSYINDKFFEKEDNSQLTIDILDYLKSNIKFNINVYNDPTIYECIFYIIDNSEKEYKPLFQFISSFLTIKNFEKNQISEIDEPFNIEKLLYMTVEDSVSDFNNNKMMFVEKCSSYVQYNVNGDDYKITFYTAGDIKYLDSISNVTNENEKFLSKQMKIDLSILLDKNNIEYNERLKIDVNNYPNKLFPYFQYHERIRKTNRKFNFIAFNSLDTLKMLQKMFDMKYSLIMETYFTKNNDRKMNEIFNYNPEEFSKLNNFNENQNQKHNLNINYTNSPFNYLTSIIERKIIISKKLYINDTNYIYLDNDLFLNKNYNNEYRKEYYTTQFDMQYFFVKDVYHINNKGIPMILYYDK